MKPGTFLSMPALFALWVGASVSLAEVMTGAYLAPMGWGPGSGVILVGHLVGAIIFGAIGWLSWSRGKPAIAVSQMAFGSGGTRLFGLLNAIQLIGWTVVMLLVGSQALDRLAATVGWVGTAGWSKLVLGGLLVLWTWRGLAPGRHINMVAVVGLVGLMAWLSWVSLNTPVSSPGNQPSILGWGAALELVLVMPLSWLPLVGDYTVGAPRGVRACVVSAVAYALGSSWMYLLGLGTGIVSGQGDPLMLLSGNTALVLAALVVVLSTVTTAVLDAHSAGLSLKALVPRLPHQNLGPIVAVVGVIIAFFVPLDRYQDFLYWIGSVFAPFYAILLAEGWAGRKARRDTPGRRLIILAFTTWAIGVGLYYLILPVGTPIGVSLPVMAVSALLYLCLRSPAMKRDHLLPPQESV